MGEIAQRILGPWRFLRAAVEDSLAQLEQMLTAWHDALTNGPIPGGYFAFYMHGSVVANQTAFTRLVFSKAGPTNQFWGFRPIEASATVAGFSVGSITVMIQYLDIAGAWVDLLAATMAPSDASMATTRNMRADFTTQYVVARALRVNTSGMVGTPVNLEVMLVVKNMKKIEPA